MDLIQYISRELEKEKCELKKVPVDYFGSGFLNLYQFKDTFLLEDHMQGHSMDKTVVLKNKEKNISITIKNKKEVKLFFGGKKYPIHERISKYAFKHLPYVDDYIKKHKIEIKSEYIHPKDISLFLLNIKYGTS